MYIRVCLLICFTVCHFPAFDIFIVVLMFILFYLRVITFIVFIDTLSCSYRFLRVGWLIIEMGLRY